MELDPSTAVALGAAIGTLVLIVGISVTPGAVYEITRWIDKIASVFRKER